MRRVRATDIQPPSAYGFGLNLLTQTLPKTLRAEVDLAFAPAGLSYSIRLPSACYDVQQADPRALHRALSMA